MRAPMWTPQEIELGKELLDRVASQDECWKLLGRTRQAIRDKLRRVEFDESVKNGLIAAGRVIVPDSVIEDRNRRLMARKSLTGMLMGDPEPNRQRL